MPIHVMDNEQTLNAWVEEFLKNRKYAVLITAKGEVILEPRKSTRPTDYGYLDTGSYTEADKIGKQLSSHFSIPVIQVKKFLWDTERGVP
jgi:hypothetical protein